jgi:ribosomal protein L19E
MCSGVNPACSSGIMNDCLTPVTWPRFVSLHFVARASTLFQATFQRGFNRMLLSRDFVAYMAGEVVKRLVDAEMIEAKAPEALSQRVRQRMADELSVEDRLNDEVREILNQHSDEMRRTGASYQEMYKKVKGQLARDRKLILR